MQSFRYYRLSIMVVISVRECNIVNAMTDAVNSNSITNTLGLIIGKER
jgi:hypothetical protein